MDPNYKPPSSLDVAKVPPRKPSPRGSMDTNVPTTSGSPLVSHTYIKSSNKFDYNNFENI